jgi:2-polyprenyl-6-methoxyphenol hydroxylase-like FAD-dependent oxidoreductase
MATSDPDVLVAGGGPVGLFAALALSRQGLGVRVVEEEWRPAARSYACALHPESLALLRDGGLTERLLDLGRRIDTLAWYEGGERRREERLGELEVPFPFLLAVSQHELEVALVDALHERHVEVSFHHRVAALDESTDPLGVDVHRLDKTSSGYAVATTEWTVSSVERLRPRFLVGADGHRSTVRSLLQVDWPPASSSELYVVFEFGAEAAEPSAEARFTTDALGTSVLWPLPGGRWRWSVPLDDQGATLWRTKSRLPASRPSAEDREVLGRLLHSRLPWFRGEPGELSWATVVRFEHRVAGSFGRDRVRLLGDAAHLGGPLGVQSMNAGLREGAALAGCLSAVVGGRAPRSLLDAWADASRREWTERAGHQVGPVGRPLVVPPPAGA